jgi:3-hydroxyisobutyrate dehydrogenase
MTDPDATAVAARPRVGIVGLGNLGLPVAGRLLDEGFPVCAVEHDPARLAAAEELGALARPSPSDLGDVAVLCVCVVDDAQVNEVLLAPRGALEVLAPGSVVAILSTVFPATVTRIAEAAQHLGVEVLDAPVSGGDRAARAGELAIMVGGPQAALVSARPVLDALGGAVFHLGGHGSGLAAKFANQLMTFANQAAAVEAVRLAKAFGVQEEQVIEVAKAGTADSWCLRHWGFFDRIAAEYDRSGTPPRNRPWRKDLWDVVTVAREMDLSVPIAGLIGQVAAPLIDERADPSQ